ncbi:MBL fold metallo-hydrolase [Lentibacillus amyloliquefaciens]|uniref:MBL fold metallo-hydrolase n=1 Tax=Lentibacillus amyloliquefaciens TaxID=1472767 RepID=A0A0U3W5X9_9BACI|nr:MBL fold metallo-hydrolase [Lentibacillus amyloliquefaciens]ALX48594.1 MBL fold metallo-hydrolase [Lentibacillus amyloliquefaciens]
MFLEKTAVMGEWGNVQFVNGWVSLRNVKMNVYCFAVDGVLIDTGSRSLLKAFKPFFAQADVDKVMITHFHEDHTGGAGYLQKKYDWPVYMNDMTIAECAQKANYPLYRQLFWGRRQPFKANPIGEAFTSRKANWDVIQTPGHAKDHLSFLNRETGQLFSGDLYVQPKTKLILREESVPTIINSIERTLTYDFGELFCCHAGYVEDGRDALTNKLHYLKELQFEIRSLQMQGYHEQEIWAMTFKKKYPITLISSGEWDSLHIVRSILHDEVGDITG